MSHLFCWQRREFAHQQPMGCLRKACRIACLHEHRVNLQTRHCADFVLDTGVTLLLPVRTTTSTSSNNSSLPKDAPPCRGEVGGGTKLERSNVIWVMQEPRLGSTFD